MNGKTNEKTPPSVNNDPCDYGHGFGFSGDYKLTTSTSLRFLGSISGSDDRTDTWGIGIAHNLGNGVSLHASGGRNEWDAEVAQVGMQFRF